MTAPRVSRAASVCRRAAEGLLAVIWAPRCAACDRPLSEPMGSVVCRTCWNQIGDVRIVQPPGRHEWPTTLHVRATGSYSGRLRQVVHAFKYDSRRSLARPLGVRMQRAGADILRATDALVPVPLHWTRRWSRGFNQAADLAHQLGPPVIMALRRVRATSPQAVLTAASRRRNVRHAFALSRRMTRRATARYIEGRSVLVVDDVYTTGATLEACARVLLDAGAREVSGLTIAVTPRDVTHRRRRRRQDAPRRPSPSQGAPPDASSSPGP